MVIWVSSCNALRASLPKSRFHPRSQRRRLWLAAPALLATVAVTQFMTAQITYVSPWKGGGFGMFSTVDAPSARFLRVSVHAEQWDQRIVIPRELTRLAQQARTAASGLLLDELASRILNMRWVGYRMSSAMRRYRTGLDTSSSSSPTRDLAERTALVSHLEAALLAKDSELDLGRYGFLRPLETGERITNGGDVIVPERVSVELWRYRYDGKSGALRASLLRRSVQLRTPLTRGDARVDR